PGDAVGLEPGLGPELPGATAIQGKLDRTLGAGGQGTKIGRDPPSKGDLQDDVKRKIGGITLGFGIHLPSSQSMWDALPDFIKTRLGVVGLSPSTIDVPAPAAALGGIAYKNMLVR